SPGDRARNRARGARRRRGDRRQGTRTRTGARRRRHTLRRRRGCRRSVACAEDNRMIPLSLDQVRALASGELEAAPWASEVSGLQTDSRRIEEGDLFVAVGGGDDFVGHAFARGAAATLVPDDAFAALGALAGAVRDRSGAR